jgi:hypothetical protein
MMKIRKSDRAGARLGVRGVAILGALGVCASLCVAAPAFAVEHHPKGDFAPFADCPLSNKALAECVLAETNAGEFTVGKKSVPISKLIKLQGGYIENEATELEEFVGAEDGNTLSKTPQTVPGGLLGIVAPSFLPKFLQELFNEFINKGITGVTATTELAAPASSIGINTENLIFEHGTALSLPVKIKLENAFLGSSCYIGSNAHPVVIEFTTGTTAPPLPNKPITGKAGTLEFKDEFAIISLTGGRLVNNSYAVPGAEGCGGILSFLIDPAINAQLGIPAAAGHNTAILEGKLQTANAKAVKASE